MSACSGGSKPSYLYIEVDDALEMAEQTEVGLHGARQHQLSTFRNVGVTDCRVETLLSQASWLLFGKIGFLH